MKPAAILGVIKVIHGEEIAAEQVDAARIAERRRCEEIVCGSPTGTRKAAIWAATRTDAPADEALEHLRHLN